LYDYANHAWLDWKGVVTARITFDVAMPPLATAAGAFGPMN
jgi:hypothetical protein